MVRSESLLREAVLEAAAQIAEAARSSPYTVFEELVPADAAGTADGRHAVGFIEGAALALGLTPIELLDECGVPAPD